jgi:hypothetical protein
MEILQKLSAVSDGPQLVKPWQLFLEQKPWRKADTGEVVVYPSMNFSGVDPHAMNPRVPTNASKFADETEICSDSDISRTMKFARDNNWEYYISLASTFDGTNAITVSYRASLEDCEDKYPWYWNQFCTLLKADNMIGLPAVARAGFKFIRRCFIGDRILHTMLFEVDVPTTEDSGPPCFFAYAPNAVMKFRAESADMVSRMITMCYDGQTMNCQTVPGKFWGLVMQINEGALPGEFKLKRQKGLNLPTAMAYNRDILSNGLTSAPYRAGTGKFAAAFKPEKPYSATIAIETGIYGEHGVAIFFEQKTRRCLLTKRLFDIPDEAVFWEVMRMWAKFEPRQAFPRKDAGQLFYPAVFSHMFEQYWDFIHAPKVEDAPNVYTGHYASDAACLVFSCDARVDAEAPEKSAQIAQSGAISRKYPVQDAQDLWSSPQEQAQEECDTVEHDFAPEPDSHNVDTGLGDPV